MGRAGSRRERATPLAVSGDTMVVSTASCAPFHKGKPLAMTSMRRSSKRATATFRSRTSVLQVTRAPASLQTRAAARSSGHPRLRKAPDLAQAARWSPRGSRGRRHRQLRADKGKGRRKRRNRRARKWSEGKVSSGQDGTLQKGRLLKGPVCENKSACLELLSNGSGSGRLPAPGAGLGQVPGQVQK